MSKSISISPNIAYIIISILILTAISWSVFNYPLYTFSDLYDFWEHSAAIREWSKDLWHPRNPHLAIDTGSPRYMPFFFLLALFARMFNLNPLQALGIGGVLNIILILCGVWLFLRIYFRNDWAPFVGLIILLGGWGIGWLWSNLYQLRSLFYVIVYPSSFAFGLTFLSLWVAKKILSIKKISLWNYIILGFISALMFLSHPPTGAFAIVSLCLLALLEGNVSFSLRCKVIGVVLTGALAAELWPYFSVWRVVLGTSGGQAESWVEAGTIDISRIKMLYFDRVRPFYNPKQVFFTLGPSLLGIPALIYLICKKKHLFIVAGFVVMSLPYLTNLVFPVPLGHRFLLFAIFYMHLALIWGILEMQSNLRTSINRSPSIQLTKIKTVTIGCFLTLCLVWNSALVLLEFEGYHLEPNLKLKTRFATKKPIVDDMRRLALYIPDDAIVLAPVRLSWPLPTFAGKVVALFHPNPMVNDHTQRRENTFIFFESRTSKEDRLEILRRYKVTHILYKKEDMPEEVRDDLSAFSSVPAAIDDYILIEVHKGLL